MLNAQRRDEQRRQQHGRQIRGQQPYAFGCTRADQLTNLGIFDMKVHEKRWQEPQPDADHRPDKNGEPGRGNFVEEFGIELQQRAAKQEDQSQAEEEEHSLKVALAPMAEDDDDPEERKQRPGSEDNET